MGKISDAIRGSGSALPEKLRAQMLKLDQEFSAMEEQIQIMEANALKLEGQVNPLEREVERLKQQVQEASTKPKADRKAIHLEDHGRRERFLRSDQVGIGSPCRLHISNSW